MTRNLSETLAEEVSSLISGGGKRKLCRAVHSVTIRSSSVLYICICCLNPDITADNVSLNVGDEDDDEDDDHDGERSIDTIVSNNVNKIQFNSR